jgi:hypothetical protein
MSFNPLPSVIEENEASETFNKLLKIHQNIVASPLKEILSLSSETSELCGTENKKTFLREEHDSKEISCHTPQKPANQVTWESLGLPSTPLCTPSDTLHSSTSSLLLGESVSLTNRLRQKRQSQHSKEETSAIHNKLRLTLGITTSPQSLSTVVRLRYTEF